MSPDDDLFVGMVVPRGDSDMGCTEKMQWRPCTEVVFRSERRNFLKHSFLFLFAFPTTMSIELAN